MFILSSAGSSSRTICRRCVRSADLGQRPYYQTNRLQELDDKRFKILWFGSDEFSARTLIPVLEDKSLWRHIHIVTAGEPYKTKSQLRAERLRAEFRKQTYRRHYPDDYGTQPDLFELAKEHKIPIQRADSHGIGGFKLPEVFDNVDPFNLVVTASFGSMITARLRNPFEPQHSLNIHPSLLPKYRGAAPIQYAILDGVKQTGVTVQRLVAPKHGVDCGPVVKLSDPLDVKPDDNYNSLMRRLADEAGRQLVTVLRDLQEGKGEADVQRGRSSKAPKIGKADAVIRWNEWNSQTFDRKFRAFGHQAPPSTVLNGIKVVFTDLRLPTAEDLGDLRLELQERNVDKVSSGDAFLSRRRKHIIVATHRGETPKPAEPVEETFTHGPHSHDKDKIPTYDEVPPPYIVVNSLKKEGRNDTPAWDWWNGLKFRPDGRVRFGTQNAETAPKFLPYSAKPASAPKAPAQYDAWDFPDAPPAPERTAQPVKAETEAATSEGAPVSAEVEEPASAKPAS